MASVLALVLTELRQYFIGLIRLGEAASPELGISLAFSTSSLSTLALLVLTQCDCDCGAVPWCPEHQGLSLGVLVPVYPRLSSRHNFFAPVPQLFFTPPIDLRHRIREPEVVPQASKLLLDLEHRIAGNKFLEGLVRLLDDREPLMLSPYLDVLLVTEAPWV